MADQDDLADDIMVGTILKTFCLGPPISAALLQSLSTAAVNMMLKGYDIQNGEALLDATTADSAMNGASLKRVEMIAGPQAELQLEEIAIVTAATFRDLLRDNSTLREALKSVNYVLDLQARERAAVAEAAVLAAKEIPLRDAQTYLDVCDLVANLAARKASDIIARRPNSLPQYRGSIASSLKKAFKRIIG